jgi:hypothetical protein
MRDWLAGIADALECCSGYRTVFFRDDDAGWSDRSLLRLADLFEVSATPLDLAVIPSALSNSLAVELAARRDGGAALGFHQHGFRHLNHEPQGRKCEFGPARSAAEQRADIAQGRDVLQQLLGDRLDPIFTPPWNRCGQDTVGVLQQLGFETLSRDRRAPPLRMEGLEYLPVDVDWQKHRDGEGPDTGAIGAAIIEALESDLPVGIMLHHAPMTAPDFSALRQLLDFFRQYGGVHCASMRSLLEEPVCA